MAQPKISIIIATKNACSLLLETLNNLHEQRYPHLEIIVVDGNSSDGTREALGKNADKVTHWISEPDGGISDAFNKGLKMATGDYINFQGAGDLLSCQAVISDLFQGVDDLSVDLVCGRVLRVNEDGKTPIWTSFSYPAQFKRASLLLRMSLPHQALFTHRRFFEQYGSFDNNIRFAMDYELLLRAYHRFPKTVVKNIIVAHWRAGGVGTHRLYEIFDEYHTIKIKHRVTYRWLLKAIDLFTRSKYYIKTKCLRLAY